VIDRLRWSLIRWRYRLLGIWDRGDDLNRRVAVEARLLATAEGKRPPPDRDECRALAYKLGVPSWAGTRNPSDDGGQR
jgi:hypothetical protein